MSKRELTFIFIIINLFLFLIFTIVMYWNEFVTDYHLIINQISLGSSIISIILAIVAITYAFLQSKTSVKQNNEMSNLLSQIREKVRDIDPLKNEVKNSKIEVTEKLLYMRDSLFHDLKQLNINKKSQDNENNSSVEIYEGLIQKYLEKFINDIQDNDKEDPKKKTFQEFYVVLTVGDYRGNDQLNTDIPISYVEHFREKTSISAIASNCIVFSDYTGVSFTLNTSTNKIFTANEVKDLLHDYSIYGLKVFSVAELKY